MSLLAKLKKINVKKSQEPNDVKAVHENEGGGFCAALFMILPVIMGGAVGWLASVGLGLYLDSFGNTELRASNVSASEKKRVVREDDGLNGFLTANPFRISPVPPPVEEEKPPVEDKPEIIGSLATAVLTGTMPNVGAWIDDAGQLRLVLIGTSFDVYTLDEVSYREATFVKGEDVVVLELLYGPKTEKRVVETPAPPPPPKPSAPLGDVVAATEEQEGQISSEMVNQLIQNPFDELKKVRLRPKDGELGLQIQWIQNDSILRQLGVRKGDVIKSVNGIPFTNMADIANSISSLMNSERFDVEVNRSGKQTSLRYVVH